MSRIESLTVAGVPIVLRFPENQNQPAPLIILWHGFGVPNSEQVLAETLPLEDVPAWKAYLGLPLFGVRLPQGGVDELMQRQLDDYVLQLLLPVIEGAVGELPALIAALQTRFNIQLDTGIGLFGFSAGGIAAMLALTESKVPITTAVVAGITKDLLSAVDAVEKVFKAYGVDLKYNWTEASIAAAKRLNFVARAKEIATVAQSPAILFLHGGNDEIYPAQDVQQLYAALLPYYEQANCPERLSLQIFANLGHQIELPTDETNSAILMDYSALQLAIAQWFTNYLHFIKS